MKIGPWKVLSIPAAAFFIYVGIVGRPEKVELSEVLENPAQYENQYIETEGYWGYNKDGHIILSTNKENPEGSSIKTNQWYFNANPSRDLIPEEIRGLLKKIGDTYLLDTK